MEEERGPMGQIVLGKASGEVRKAEGGLSLCKTLRSRDDTSFAKVFLEYSENPESGVGTTENG